MPDIMSEEKEKNSLPILTPESGVHKYLQEINRIPSLSHEEEFMLAKAYIENQDLNAAHRLVTSHLKLVAKIAIGFRNYGIPTSELISEGNLGLMHAVKKFNPELGFRLSTYAMWWIKAAIQEYILKSWSLVKIGTTAAQKKLFFSLNKIKNKIRNSKSREIIDEDYQDIANDLGVQKSEVIEMDKRLSRSDISLNSPSSSDDESSSELIEYIPETRPSHEIVLSNREEISARRELLLKALKELNERELIVIQERRLKDSPSTLEDLSVRFGISKERVRQIENKAFEKIQKYILPLAE
jgi:RNA polymerase sigma-32 factor